MGQRGRVLDLGGPAISTHMNIQTYMGTFLVNDLKCPQDVAILTMGVARRYSSQA